ncbi:uncharacterized GPI-anchored protein At4g28100 [Impatiens glandulifera]|uniref:uncharacterized GPI-anchored protein At4g28100 n=1 Tax=Impatiens glandulifera TaxID=253017 RepID=UPI001FB18685|nr:uncharacterized GPI-anchored protein At4g28100 [Impatiens glandulifera]
MVAIAIANAITLITLFSLLTTQSALTHQTQVQSLLISSPPATIPAFPEQSDASGCRLDLPGELFRGVKSACSVGKGKTESDRSSLSRRVRCCPVLAAWVYAAYSETALGRAGRAPQTAAFDLPMLPDDSETCLDGLQNALNNRGIDLVKPNETCDLVYCFCGIRLHPFSCPEVFRVSENGKLVGDERVVKLEKDCLGNLGLAGCSKCLQTLHLFNEKKSKNMSSIEDRSSKMHTKDCKLMGLTWLLAKDRPAYIHTVSAVLRAMMMSTNGSDPRTCSVSSYGMPLAVDSSEISGQPSVTAYSSLALIYALSISFLYILLVNNRYMIS